MIKKRNLDPSLINWIMNVTGLGPGIGEIKYLVPTSSSTSQFRTQLQSMGVEDCDMYTSLVTAEANLVAYRNDILLVMPGLYTETVTTDWTKAHTHIIGLGGPTVLTRQLRPNVLLYTDTAAVDYVLHITGQNCQFHNFVVQNGTTGGSATGDNLAAIGLAGYGEYFKSVGIQGIGTAAQVAAAGCSSLNVLQGAGESLFRDCRIGANTYVITRTTTTQGHVLLNAGSTAPSPQNMTFEHCLFLSRSETAGVPMIKFGSVYGMDRLWLFEDCFFSNFASNGSTACTRVFGRGGQSIQTTNVRLIRCGASGYTYWQDAGVDENVVYGDTISWPVMTCMPASGAGGGLSLPGTGACA